VKLVPSIFQFCEFSANHISLPLFLNQSPQGWLHSGYDDAAEYEEEEEELVVSRGGT
jgi:hypothetical protein